MFYRGANFCTIISKYLTHILLFIGSLIPYSPNYYKKETEITLRTEVTPIKRFI